MKVFENETSNTRPPSFFMMKNNHRSVTTDIQLQTRWECEWYK